MNKMPTGGMFVSYMIRYGQEMKQERRLKQKYIHQWICWFCLAVAVMTGFLWPQAREVAQQLLCPWLEEGTVVAFQGMIQRIGAGSAVPVAFVEFCREIVINAGIPV